MLQVSVRQGGTISPCYLSPEGKRFTSLDQVKAQVQEKEKQREEERRRRRKRKRKQTEAEPDTSEPVAKKLRFEGDEESQGEVAGVRSLPAEILKRRRLMTARSPFRNLLKRTLVRNHVRVRGRMVPPPPPATTSSKRSSDEEEEDNDDSEDFNPPSKKLRPAPAAAVTPPRPPATPMFPPPNLTPPVVRRPQPDPQEVSRRPQGDPKEVRRPPISAITFASPNQRPLTSRLTKQGSKGPASPAACKPAPS